MTSALAPRDRIIVALDVPDLARLERYLDQLERQPTFYKIGLELFVAAGAQAVEAVQRRGGRLFLDLKLHDIPETVSRAVVAAVGMGVDFLTIHAAGGIDMMKRAQEAAAGHVTILGVTVLTSLTDEDLQSDGIIGGVASAVRARARLAARAGIGGLVCSPLEVADARSEAPMLELVVPGVRPAGAALGDQKRVATPAQAIANGADYVVLGRPLRDSPMPAQAFAAVVAEIAAATP